MWSNRSVGAKDNFDHLPTVDAWVRAAPTVRELAQRAGMWLDAEKSMGNQYAYGVDQNGPARVGYNPEEDEVFFLVKGYKGNVYIASPVPLEIG